MPGELTQVFPGRVDGRIVHRSWTVDLAGALGSFPGLRIGAARLRAEAEEMSLHFPRWLLTVHRERDVRLCPECRGMLVFDRGLRCVGCDRLQSRPPQGAELAWFGLLPPIGIDALRRLRDGLAGSPPEHHVVGTRDPIGRYLLVPLIVTYPQEFPDKELQVRYLPGFFRMKGMPGDSPSHSCHLLGGGRMCLFAPGQWASPMTCRQVLQQRAYAHVIKLLNYADGNHGAFAIVS